jgi:hypothetical protein
MHPLNAKPAAAGNGDGLFTSRSAGADGNQQSTVPRLAGGGCANAFWPV